MTNLPPRFLRRYGKHAPFVARSLTNTYGHLALARLAEIYDECDNGDGAVLGAQHGRKMSDIETAFALDIRAADARRSESLANARRMFGFGTTGYLATERLASNQRDDDYQRALDKYELAVESQDELDEIDGTPVLMAEAAE